MSHFEYMKIPLRCFPQVIINQYNIIYSVKKDVFVYVKICKSIYSLKQVYFIYFDPLVKLLKPHGCYPLNYNPGIWYHEMLPTKFTLCVDDFGIKYTNTDHCRHIFNAIDWEGKNTVDLL